ncbi:hypothetical protein V6x_46790 [Gimesia chilikensis]|uniref:Spore protein YkvP/CgeB glycosyl transferase-like domain-containing protein n=1 Tax=Gimesia chilikensis TaxID=2605989 RepID=A0A517WI73_9PLAN|nr:glycosyltransferase [Gimesia chilikensis]QDU04948.1 hypothetical protein V6x_46790 [Gimesia chilikensis]
MSHQKSILISGASYDALNNNSVLRSYVTEGFQEILGADQVHQVALDYVIEGLEKYKPDILLMFGSCMPDDISYQAVKKHCQTHDILLSFWLHDDPYEIDYRFKVEDVADVIFSNDKWASQYYAHPHVFHMPLAASKKTHFRQVTDQFENDIFFCGVAFANRVQLIKDLAPVLSKYKTVIRGAEWPVNLADYVVNQTISNEKLIEYYGNSRITLNVGRHFDYANNRFQLVPSTPGPRTFEAAMAGAVQFFFTESLEILDYYEDGTEIVLFDSVSDFGKQLEKLYDDPQSLVKIGQAAQQKTLAQHSYANRAASILDILAQHS